MRTSTATQNAAILSKFRQLSMTVNINGSTTQWPVTEFQTDAQMIENPIAISTIGGVAARQVKFKIDHTYASAMSPYPASIVPAPLPLPMGAAVVVTVNFWPGSSRTGTPTYTANIFTGNVINIPVIDGITDISVWAQDASYNLGTLVNLPAAGVIPAARLDLTQDLYYSPLCVIDLLLRACGQYLTAPPVLAGAQRAAYTILSIPGVGGNIPDIGTLVQAYLTPAGTFTERVTRTPGKFTPDVIGSNGAVYAQTVKMATLSANPFTLYRVDGWFKTDDTIGSGYPATILNGGSSAGTAGSCPSIAIDSFGNIVVAANGVTGLTTSGVNVMDGAWHHLNVTFTRPTPTSITITIIVDGGTPVTASPTVVAGVSLFPMILAGDPGTWLVVGGDGSPAVIWLEAFEVIFVPLGVTYTDPPDRNGQTAGMVSAITPTSTRMKAIAPQTGINAWQTIQAIAEAEGAFCWFDEDGKFIFEPQAIWMARRIVAPVRTFDASMFANLSFQLNADSLRKTITANYTTTSAKASTAAIPAYVETTVLTFATGLTITQIVTPELFFNPSIPAVGASNAVGNSWFVPVAASSVGDPAAAVLSGISVVIIPNATGFALKVTNPYGPIAFWNPSDGTIPQGPALIIHGTRIITSPPIAASYTGNVQAKDDLLLPDNPWRGDALAAQRLCYVTAMETYNIIPVVSNIDVPGDPRLQLGDLVTLTDGRPNSLIRTPGGVPCVVVDIAHNVSPTTDYRMTLAVRPAGPPTGWIAGVPGRSEAGTTTYASLP